MPTAKLEKRCTYRQWLISLFANTTMITCGLQTGWISPMTKVLQSDLSPTGHPLSDTDLSWIASIFCLLAVAGVYLYTYIADKVGRKMGVVLIAVPQALCWLLKFSSANIAVLIISRVFSGLAVGGCFSIIPIYVKEISQDNIRGLTGSLLMLLQNIGILVMYILGAYLDYFTVLWIVVWLPIISIVLMLKSPESPSYLVKIGKLETAKSTIAWLRGLNEEDKEVIYEIQNIINEKRLIESLPDISYSVLFAKREWCIGILLMMTIMTLNALNGCLSIVTYASSILTSSGVTMNAELQSMSFPCLMIVGGFISMACVEKFGRKVLIVITNVLISGAMFGLGLVVYLQSQGQSLPCWLPAALMMTAVTACAIGVAPVPYIMMSEMFNFQIRAKVLGLTVSCGYLASFLQLLVYAPVVSAIGTHGAFYIFGVFTLLAFCISLILPETKGKSVKEIEAKFQRK